MSTPAFEFREKYSDGASVNVINGKSRLSYASAL